MEGKQVSFPALLSTPLGSWMDLHPGSWGKKKVASDGTSLVAQWLGLRNPKAGNPGSIPGQGPRSHTLERGALATGPPGKSPLWCFAQGRLTPDGLANSLEKSHPPACSGLLVAAWTLAVAGVALTMAIT